MIFKENKIVRTRPVSTFMVFHVFYKTAGNSKYHSWRFSTRLTAHTLMTQCANPFANWLITPVVDTQGPRLLARCSHGHRKDQQTASESG